MIPFMRSIGFLGLGVMGYAMTANLIDKSGLKIVGYDPVPELRERFARRGGVPAADPHALYGSCDLIMMCLPTYAILQAAVSDILKTAGPGTVLVDLGATSPFIIRDLYRSARDRGMHLIDAPVSGGQAGAERGALSIMAGGDQDVLDAVLPYLRMIGSSVTYMGGPGCGSTAKLANNMISGVTLAAIGEAFALAKKAGLDPRTLYEAIRGGFAQSTALDMRAERILNHDFLPASGRAAIQLKDANGALELAERLGVQLPLTRVMADNLNWLADQGLADEDHSAMVRYYEARMGVTL